MSAFPSRVDVSREVAASAFRPTTTRRSELDAILVLGLVLFHTALVFDTHDDFYVKDGQTAELIGILARPIIVWASPPSS